jgi:hypothetical protein
LTCIAIGGQLAIVGFGVNWRARGLRFPTQPGHWLAIVQVLGYLTVLGCQWWSIKMQRDEDPMAMDVGVSRLLLLQLCSNVGIGMLGAWLALMRREDQQWRVLYLIVACSMAAAALPAVMFFSPMAHSWFMQLISPYGWQKFREYVPAAVVVGMFAGVATCMGLDLLEKRSRDWVHWAGTTLYLASSGVTIAASLV